MTVVDKQTEVDLKNTGFWDELCGTNLAKEISIRDDSPDSLAKYDSAYMDLYPYLPFHLNAEGLRGKEVLEIGLGYGTVGQKLASYSKSYTGLDIAQGPVEMMNHRLKTNNLTGRAVVGSILEPPFSSNSFDFICAIGSLHHTGDLRHSIENVWNLLRPGGKALIMVYSQFAFAQWRYWPRATFKILLRELNNNLDFIPGTEKQRVSYDADSRGDAAPATEFSSIKRVNSYFLKFSEVACYKENFIDIKWKRIFGTKILVPRKIFLNNLAKICGSDIYIHAKK